MLVTYNITFTPSPGSYGTLIEYRKAGETTWTKPNTPANPTMKSTYPITIDDASDYTVRISTSGAHCDARYKYLYIQAGSEPVNTWWEGDYVCEKEDRAEEVASYTGFSSPFVVYPNPLNNMVYVIDHDYVSGNNYKFNPTTFTGVSSISVIPGLTTVVYNGKVDKTYNRLYMVGKDTGGLKVLQMNDDTYLTIPYGNDGVDYNRIPLAVGPTYIYVADKPGNEVAIIHRENLTLDVTGTRAAFPSGNTYLQDQHFVITNSEVWSVADFRSVGTVGVYNPLLSTLSTTITLPGIAFESGSSRYRQAGFYEPTFDRVYIGDAGSKKMFVLDATSKTLLHTFNFTNTLGLSNTLSYVGKDPVTGDHFIACQGYNSAGVNPVYRTYKVNIDTLELEHFYIGSDFTSLNPQAGTAYLWEGLPYSVKWSGGSTWSTDGIIKKYSK